MKQHRVVITGAGVVTPFGRGVSAMMEGIRAGRSTVRRMDEWEEYKGVKSRVGAPAEVGDVKHIPRQKRRSMSPMSFFSVFSAEEALAQAGLDMASLPPERVGVITGSTLGSAVAINEFFEMVLPHKNVEDVPAMQFFKCMSHSASMNVAQYFGLKGYVMATSAACASGLQAIGTGYQLLKLGLQDVFICGGAEELHASVTGTFDLLYATSTKYNDSPELTPRPFDRDRDGLVCGEGGGLVVMETLEHAEKRGAEILAEITGYETAGSGEHVSQSDTESMVRCMKGALSESGLGPADIGYINAHATATLQGDKAEADAIREVFGPETPVSSLKGYMGHTLGASGAIELIATIEMMRSDIIYPGLNLRNVADDCQGIGHLMDKREAKLKAVLKNCFAFGGVNTAMVCVRP